MDFFQPFSGFVWAMFCAFLLTFSILLFTTHRVYQELDDNHDVKLIQSKKVPLYDFFIFPWAKFVEPEPIPWFINWSTGIAFGDLMATFTELQYILTKKADF